MFSLKGIIVSFIFLVEKTCLSHEWIPFGSQGTYQKNYGKHHILKPTPQYVLYPPEVNPKEYNTEFVHEPSQTPSQLPLYKFSYKISYPKGNNYQEKSETRVGDTVTGFYRVVEPSGQRLVEYASDSKNKYTQVNLYQGIFNDKYLFG